MVTPGLNMKGVFLFLLCGQVLQSARRVRYDTNSTEIILKNFTGKEEAAFISSRELHIWSKPLHFDSQDDLYRVRAQISATLYRVDSPYPFIQFTVSNGRESVAFHLPERISNGTLVYETSRVIHPLYSTQNRQLDVHQSLIVTAHSNREKPFNYTLGIQALSEGQYVIRLSKNGEWELPNQKVGVGRPEAYFWDTSEVKMAKITIKSDDLLCGILYLNNREESIYYQNGEINTEPRSGFRTLTFSGRLDLNLDRESLKDKLYLYILLQPDDSLCDPGAVSRNLYQNKHYNITVAAVEEVGFLVPLTFFLGLFLAPPFLLVFYVLRQLPNRDLQPLNAEPPLIVFESSPEPPQQNDCFEMESLRDNGHDHLVVHSAESFPPPDEFPPPHPMVKDVSSWSAGDLTFIFFMVPGLLLGAFHYAQSLSFNRREDSCYHNYGCAVSWGPVTAFNHLISNVGYILNGSYYTVFIVIRHRHHYKERGPFNNYGLELSLGMALVCQGLASTIYHICPSSISFTFDTPFMQAICVLVMLKLYGNRHGSISPSFANGIVAAVLAANICTTFSEHTVLSRLTVGVVQLALVAVALHKIFKGNSMIHGELWTRNANTKYKIFGAIIVFTNLFMAAAYNSGMYKSSQFVTIFCIVNMTLYLSYYYFMKIQAREKYNWLSTTAGGGSTLLWAVAAAYFFHEETNWMLTPAQSRNLNSECLLFSYYDRHDFWHLLSAEAVFSSLIALSTLDDAQATFPRTEIIVF